MTNEWASYVNLPLENGALQWPTSGWQFEFLKLCPIAPVYTKFWVNEMLPYFHKNLKYLNNLQEGVPSYTIPSPSDGVQRLPSPDLLIFSLSVCLPAP